VELTYFTARGTVFLTWDATKYFATTALPTANDL